MRLVFEGTDKVHLMDLTEQQARAIGVLVAHPKVADCLVELRRLLDRGMGVNSPEAASRKERLDAKIEKLPEGMLSFGQFKWPCIAGCEYTPDRLYAVHSAACHAHRLRHYHKYMEGFAQLGEGEVTGTH